LRELGQAQLDGGDGDAAAGVIEEIARLDAKAFAHNVECAALKGRWHETRKQLQQARDLYREALAHSPQSYYLADLLGQVLLALGDGDGAREAYAQATRILDEGSDRSIWIHATAATAAIVDGREEDGIAELRKIRDFNPGLDELTSIERGLVRLRAGLKTDDAAFGRWRTALRGRDVR
jgi:tetratricopeptide (TPR) repeat protein